MSKVTGCICLKVSMCGDRWQENSEIPSSTELCTVTINLQTDLTVVLAAILTSLLYWTLADLQHCVSFRYTTKWLRFMCKYSFSDYFLL